MEENNTCLICWEPIQWIDLVICCTGCNILLHTYCEESYRNTRGHCKCPHCQEIGTLMVIQKRYLINDNKDKCYIS